MVEKSIIHNFNYSQDDIVNLIKSDVAKKLNMETIPIINYSISFNITMEDAPNDYYASEPLIPVFKNVIVKLEVPR